MIIKSTFHNTVCYIRQVQNICKYQSRDFQNCIKLIICCTYSRDLVINILRALVNKLLGLAKLRIGLISKIIFNLDIYADI